MGDQWMAPSLDDNWSGYGGATAGAGDTAVSTGYGITPAGVGGSALLSAASLDPVGSVALQNLNPGENREILRKGSGKGQQSSDKSSHAAVFQKMKAAGVPDMYIEHALSSLKLLSTGGLSDTKGTTNGGAPKFNVNANNTNNSVSRSEYGRTPKQGQAAEEEVNPEDATAAFTATGERVKPGKRLKRAKRGAEGDDDIDFAQTPAVDVDMDEL